MHQDLAEINTMEDDIHVDKQTINDSDTSLNISVDDIDWNEPFELDETVSSTEDLIDHYSNTENITNTTISREDHSMEFCREYSFSETMLEILRVKFGLENFRPGQREIINAVLNKYDCFVLMPTGGGKSLCYQLPAILSKGVTIVISPLIALISDQVDKLNSLDIRAAHLCCTLSRQQSVAIISKLYMPEPEIDLLYVTPERLIASLETKRALDCLYKRGKLSRFVMDEVHCLSLWGHDFRPHYKQLASLRQEYSDIQIVCFTATATKQVETDVVINLKLKNVKRFIRSFNRPNIKYQVIDKVEETPINEIVTLIRQKFFRKSGIIYCLTRKDCVILSRYLRIMGIAAKPYHAGLKNEVREKTQKEWMQEKFHVIVATIAFGMGIDKPNVRFVIHNMIPKSLEAYYQESGRAGRDGEISYSYLFYNYNDVRRTMKLMRGDFAKSDTLDGHFDNLEQMVAFANNQIDCRRYLQLLNLGETFDRRVCMQNRETVCDNCEHFNNDVKDEIDITKQAKELSILVQDISRLKKITLNTALKIYKGAKGLYSHKYFGNGKLMSRLDIHRILRELIVRNVLANDYITTGEFPLVYVKPGSELQSFLSSTDIKLTIPVANRRAVQTELIQTNHTFSATVNNDQLPPVAATLSFSEQLKYRCYNNLLQLCRNLGVQRNISVASILHPLAIKYISEVLPTNREALLNIQHVTIATFNKFGEQILKVTNHFKQQMQTRQIILNCTRSSNTSSSESNSHKRTYSEAFVSCDNNNNTANK